MNTEEDILVLRLTNLERIADIQSEVIEQKNIIIDKQSSLIERLKSVNNRLTLLALIQVSALILLALFTTGCGGQIEGPAPTDAFEPRPHLPEGGSGGQTSSSEPRTKCESIQQAPLLSCCFGSVCDLDCSPHDSGIACYIPHAQECLFYETAELECYATAH